MQTANGSKPVELPSPYVSFTVDLGGDGCPPESCLDGYELFVSNHLGFAKQVDSVALESEIQEAYFASVHPRRAVNREEIATAVLSALGTQFLYDEDWSQRPISAALIRKQDIDGSRLVRETYLIEDDSVGKFEVRVLRRTDILGAQPGILALHGHAESGQVMEDRFLGRRLAEEGFVVLFPQFRAMSCMTSTEGRLAIDLMRGGFTLMGLQVYEVILSRPLASFRTGIPKAMN